MESLYKESEEANTSVQYRVRRGVFCGACAEKSEEEQHEAGSDPRGGKPKTVRSNGISGGTRGKYLLESTSIERDSKRSLNYQSITAKESKAAVGYQLKRNLDLTRVKSKRSSSIGLGGTGTAQNGARGKATVQVDGPEDWEQAEDVAIHWIEGIYLFIIHTACNLKVMADIEI